MKKYADGQIDCNKRLPKESDGVVLAGYSSGEVSTARYSEFSSQWFKGDMCGLGGEDPVVWMLPPKVFAN